MTTLVSFGYGKVGTPACQCGQHALAVRITHGASSPYRAHSAIARRLARWREVTHVIETLRSCGQAWILVAYSGSNHAKMADNAADDEAVNPVCAFVVPVL
jgi:hypothetical protein